MRPVWSNRRALYTYDGLNKSIIALCFRRGYNILLSHIIVGKILYYFYTYQNEFLKVLEVFTIYTNFSTYIFI